MTQGFKMSFQIQTFGSDKVWSSHNRLELGVVLGLELGLRLEFYFIQGYYGN